MISRNNTSFPIFLASKLKKYYNDYLTLLSHDHSEEAEIASYLKYHQYLIRKMYLEIENYSSRGYLIYHHMGTGKSFVAAAISLALSQIKETVFLANKSLHKNFKDSIDRLSKAFKLPNKFSVGLYVSMDAYNSAEQFMKTRKTENPLDNKLLIVDECHNLFRGIINSSNENTNSQKIYRMIMSAKNITIVFLTGTPCVKHPFEMVACFNMLVGYDLLPTNYEVFEKYFMEGEDELKNLDRFSNRIMGLVSYIHPLLPQFPDDQKTSTSLQDYPSDLGTEIIYIEMTPEQYSSYVDQMKIENVQKFNMNKVKKSVSLSLPDRSGSSFHVGSRQICNLGKKTQIVIDIIKQSEGICLVYSEFTGPYGLEQIVDALKKENINYVIISGDVSQDEREVSRLKINSPENNMGEITKVILISRAGAEGIDLSNIRTIIIFEAPWEYSRIEQVKARAIRYKSHDTLPFDKRCTKTFLLLTKTSEDVEKPIDQIIYERSIKHMQLNNKMRDVLKSVCIECISNNYTNCRICDPTNVKLFEDDIDYDLQLPDPCHKLDRSNLEKEIKFDGEFSYDGIKIRYVADEKSLIGIRVYKFLDSINFWIELSHSEEDKEILNEAIKKKQESSQKQK